MNVTGEFPSIGGGVNLPPRLSGAARPQRGGMALSPSRSFKSLPGSSDDNAKPALGAYWLQLALGFGKSSASRVCILTIVVIASVIIYAKLSTDIQVDAIEQVSPIGVSGTGYSMSPLSFAARWLMQQAPSQAHLLPPSLNDSFNSYAMAVNIWDVYPPTLNCPDMERIGKMGEGGKWICAVRQLQDRPHCVMYSFGISTDVSFEVEVLRRTSCRIFAFDPTIGQLPFRELPSLLNQTLTGEMKGRITFHKSALSTASGSSAYHALNEQLQDIMHRYNHSFIDLLKVDIEGGEWTVFSQQYNLSRSGHISGLPVGQLLIELHHQSPSHTSHFFRVMHYFGLYPFSREINLIPCMGGGKPFAVEYSFINPQRYFSEGAISGLVPAIVTPSWHKPIDAVIYMLTMRRRIPKLLIALESLFQNLLKDYPYPVIVFHDDFSPEDVAAVRRMRPEMVMRFHKLTFSVPTSLSARNITVPERTQCDPQFSTVGYRHMCRFHAYGVHEQLRALGVRYEYVLRLDDDSLLTSPLGYDPFRFMKANNKLYGFVNIVEDDRTCVQGLWEAARRFAMRADVRLPNSSFLRSWPDPSVFYNNFEISHVSVWQSTVWRKWVDEVESSGGIYLLRWGDAPLHTIGVSMVVGKFSIHAFRDIGYRHLPWVDQEPRGLPMPQADPFVDTSHCTFYEKWICPRNMSLTNTTGNVSMHHSLLGHLNDDLAFKTQEQYRALVERERGVLFTFGHARREDKLVATIYSFFTNYARAHPVTFAVFYLSGTGFDAARVRAVLNASVLVFPHVIFVPVRGPAPVPVRDGSSVAYSSACVSSDPEARQASAFLRREAFRVLKARGFEWFFRFADDSALGAPIEYNIFHRMFVEKKLYGYKESVAIQPECVAPANALGRQICDQLLLSGAPANCTKLFAHMYSVFLTSFQVSHASLWDSGVAAAVFEGAGEGSTRPNMTAGRALSDSIVHTMVALMSLQPSQLLQFTDVDYSFRWNSALQSATQDIRLQTNSYSLRESVYLSSVFSKEPVGWLGGDVATSVPLPPRQGRTRLVWLFGDSVLGSSRDGRRQIEGAAIVANTVGISVLGNDGISTEGVFTRTVDHMRYYWRRRHGAGSSSPLPIFEVKEPLCGRSSPRVWPITGMAVEGERGEDDRLVLVAQVSCDLPADSPVDPSHPRSTAKALSFDALHTALVVVHNVHDPPDMWLYDYKLLPAGGNNSANAGVYRWMALLEERGHRVARMVDTVLLLGSLQPTASQLTGHQVIARIKAADLVTLQVERVEVLNSVGRWAAVYGSNLAVAPQQIFGPIISEASWIVVRGEFIVVSLSMTEHYVQVCSARQIVGPYSCAFVAEIPAMYQHPRLIAYAAKAHPDLAALSSREDLVLSFVTNVLEDPAQLFESENNEVYLPKFILLQKK